MRERDGRRKLFLLQVASFSTMKKVINAVWLGETRPERWGRGQDSNLTDGAPLHGLSTGTWSISAVCSSHSRTVWVLQQI